MTFTHSDLFKEFDVKVPVGSEVVNTNTAIEIKKQRLIKKYELD